MKDGAWTCAYVGDDAEKAKATYTDVVNANAGAVMLFIRPDFTRRFRGKPLPVEAKPTEPAPVEAKPKKGGK